MSGRGRGRPPSSSTTPITHYTKPPFYPDISIPTPPTNTNREVIFHISKKRELHQRFKESIFHKTNCVMPNVHKYNEKNNAKLVANNVLKFCLKGKIRTEMGKYLPEELVRGQQKYDGELSENNIIDTIKDENSIDSTEEQPENEKQNIKTEEEQEPTNEYEELDDEGELEDTNDYLCNYYESEGDDDDDDEEGPTF